MEESFAAEKDLLDVDAVAAHPRVGTVTIYRWCREASLPCLKSGRSRRIVSARHPNLLPEFAEKTAAHEPGPGTLPRLPRGRKSLQPHSLDRGSSLRGDDRRRKNGVVGISISHKTVPDQTPFSEEAGFLLRRRTPGLLGAKRRNSR
jgi:hypothetical protein